MFSINFYQSDYFLFLFFPKNIILFISSHKIMFFKLFYLQNQQILTEFYSLCTKFSLFFAMETLDVNRLILKCHNRSTDSVSRNIYCGTDHIEDSIDPHNQCNCLDWKTNRLEHHGECDQSDTWNSCRPD